MKFDNYSTRRNQVSVWCCEKLIKQSSQSHLIPVTSINSWNGGGGGGLNDTFQNRFMMTVEIFLFEISTM